MEPVVGRIDANARLVMMEDGFRLQLLVQSPLEGLKSFGAAVEHGGEGAGADALTEKIGKELTETVEGDQLMHLKVDGEGQDLGAVLGRLLGTGGGWGPVELAAGGTLLGGEPVFGDLQPEWGEVEDLAPLLVGDGLISERLTTPGALVRCRVDHALIHIGLRDQTQGVPSWQAVRTSSREIIA